MILKQLTLLIFILFITSCNNKEDEFSNLSFDKELVKNINFSEQLLRKIETYSQPPSFYVEKDSIYLFNTTINFNKRDYLVEGRVNPNKQNIYYTKSIKGLTAKEVIQLKESIYYISNNNLNSQEYTLYNPYKKGIYLYVYKFEDWMFDEPNKIIYLSVLDDEIIKDKWFKSKFKILKKINNIYLLNMK